MKILLIGFFDGYANSIRPQKVAEYLRAKGHQVMLFDSQQMLWHEQEEKGVTLPLGFKIKNALLEKMEKYAGSNAYLYGNALQSKLRARGRLLAEVLPIEDFDLIGIHNPLDSYMVLESDFASFWYDCPTPLADELLFGEAINLSKHDELLKDELHIYSRSKYVSYHWHSYLEYAKSKYRERVSDVNWIKADWGCNVENDIAEYDDDFRLVYMGYLGGGWIDIELLSRLTKQYPIDVYGAPEPDASLGLNYKGYATPDVLVNYHAGVITCTMDELRKHGFSAKHLGYLSYGLPVLVPEWRESAKDIEGSVFYTEDSFKDVVYELRNEDQWNRVQKKALKQARKLEWNTTLKGLDVMLRE